MQAAREGELTATERERILKRVVEIQAAEEISDAAVARIIGCGRSTFSQIRRGRYKGDTQRYLRKARQWLEDRDARAATPRTEYVETTVGRLIMTVCRRAWQMPCIGLVITPSGAGKTSALTEFARRRGERAMYIQAGQAASSMLGLIGEIAERLGLATAGARYGVAGLYRMVRQRLAGYYAGGKADPYILLIDEATTLRPSVINMLRNLHDEPCCRAAIVLADTWRLDAELHSKAGMAGGYEQLRSRSGAQYQLRPDVEISAKDVRLVADATLRSIGVSKPLSAAAYKYLHKVAQADGKLRNVAHRIHAVSDVAPEGTAPSWSVHQLDYVATMVGAECQIEHQAVPFGQVA